MQDTSSSEYQPAPGIPPEEAGRDAEAVSYRMGSFSRSLALARGRSPSEGLEQAAAGALEGGQRYDSVLHKLDAFKKGHRQRSMRARHKQDWREEYGQIMQLLKATERDVAAVADDMMGTADARVCLRDGYAAGRRACTVSGAEDCGERDECSGSSSETGEVIRRDLELDRSRERERSATAFLRLKQRQELRSLLAVLKPPRQQRREQEQEEEEEGGAGHGGVRDKGAEDRDMLQATASYAARFLLQLRAEHTAEGEVLAREEEEATQELAEAKSCIGAMLALQRTPDAAAILNRVGLDISNVLGGCLHNEQQVPESGSPEVPAHDSGGQDAAAPATADGSGEARKEHAGRNVELCDDVAERLVGLELVHRWQELCRAHAAVLKALETSFVDKAAAADAAGAEDLARDKCGGWEAEEHFRFQKLANAFKGRSTGAKGLRARLVVELPHRTEAEIMRHEKWYRAWTYFMSRRKAQLAHHERVVGELVAWAKDAAEKARLDAEAAQERVQELERRNARQAALHSQLERYHEEQREREAEQATQAATAASEQRALLSAAEQKRAEEMERNKRRLDDYRRQLEKVREEERRREAAQGRAEEEERSRRQPVNLQRVVYRKSLAEKKEDEKLARQRTLDELEARRAEVLQSIAESVPYYDRVVNAKAKLDHITAAVLAHQQGFQTMERARGHAPMLGYDSKRVLKDPTFRLGLALREAGVAHTKAAHHAILSALPSRAAAPFFTGPS